MKVFVLRADYGRYTDVFKRGKYIGIGWFGRDATDPDLEKWDLQDKDFLKEKYREKYGQDEAYMRVNQNVGQISRFVNDIKVGDVIISPYNTNELLIGKISSDLYVEDDGTSPYTWRKKVEWLKDNVSRHIFSNPLQNTLRSSLTCFEVKQREEIFGELGLDIPISSTKAEVLATPKSHYELIRNKFLELDPTEFELLVSYLLRTMGFEPTQETGKVGDGGIDFEGVLDVNGIASVNLQVQVKRYDNTSIGEKDIRAFRGALKRDFQGCFITLSRFVKKAIESAADKERDPIQLIDGTKFIELFIQQYDEIIDVIQEDDNDEMLAKLQFRKSLLPI
jgi:restriction system protein